MGSGADPALSDPGTVRPAATLCILRDRAGGVEVLLTVRPKELRFMGGAVVFPGGAVADPDGDTRWERVGQEGVGDASPDALARAAAVCALREAFEEVGFPPSDDPIPELRRDGMPEDFLEAFLRAQPPAALRPLIAAGRWVTPLGASLRFDARFFVVAAPQGWEPLPDPREVARCYWSSPARALSELASGSVVMAPPTIEMLQRLATFSSTDEALATFATGEGIGSEHILSMRLSPLVQVVLAPNPGVMTGPGTNTYVFGAGPTAVIDPAVDDDEYLDEVVERAGDIRAILVTHRHSDHVGGARALAERVDAPVRGFGTNPAGDAPVIALRDGDRVGVGGAELEVLHTPGHSSDHVCFYFAPGASLFAGDNVLGEGTAVIAPPDGNMSDYLRSLQRMQDLAIDRIYPGHFRPLDGGTSVIADYIAHRLDRERKILEALSPDPVDLDRVVASAYADTPSELHPIARYSALAHLDKLVEEKRARKVDDQWVIAHVV